MGWSRPLRVSNQLHDAAAPLTRGKVAAKELRLELARHYNVTLASLVGTNERVAAFRSRRKKLMAKASKLLSGKRRKAKAQGGAI